MKSASGDRGGVMCLSVNIKPATLQITKATNEMISRKSQARTLLFTLWPRCAADFKRPPVGWNLPPSSR